MKRTGGPISAKDSECDGIEAGEELEMLYVLGEDIEAEVERGGTDNQIFKRDREAFFRLFALNASGKLGDLKGNGVDSQVHEGYIGKIPTPLPICIRPPAKGAVRQLNDTYCRKA
jgi:hypothetical protein